MKGSIPMTTDWRTLVPTSDDVYAYQGALYCDDCAEQIIEELDAQGAEDDGDSEQYPQGPHSDGGGESDSPYHCDNGAQCVNAVQVPGGAKIGCPFGNPMTVEGLSHLVEAIADDVLRQDDHARAVGRLWRSIYSEVDAMDLIKITPGGRQVCAAWPANLGELFTVLDVGTVPCICYTNLDYLYGHAIRPDAIVLWRAEITPEGNFANLENVALPESEIGERTVTEMITEAMRDGAWD
jgi:hypothetical protein